MALTATAQSALREPAWDEVIVPTLRKRLQDESSVLARRISAASIGSADEQYPDLYQPGAFVPRQESASPTLSSQHQKPSAIPRPSLQQSRTAADQCEGTSRPSQPTRARTYSQPFLFDSSSPASAPPTPSEPPRSASPLTNGKVTRIPVSRGGAGSTSSYVHGPANGGTSRGEGSNVASKHSGELHSSLREPPELSSGNEGQRSYTSRSTVRMPRHKASELFNEPAPFDTNSWISSSNDPENDPAASLRLSTDSEERPFEHWYRGDVSRNGGVGELRIGRREEMLDIANYGHAFRKASHVGLSNYSRSRSTSRGRDTVGLRMGSRQRAESVGATVRQSIYIDDDENARTAGMVLDEQPLTDLESDEYEEQEQDVYEQDVVPHPNGTISSPSLTLTGPANDHIDASKQRQRQHSVSRIPTPTFQRQISVPPPTPTPTKPVRGASEPGTSSATSTPRSQRLPRSQSQPQNQGQRTSPSAKSRTKSPATPVSASSARRIRPKGTKPPSSMAKKISRKDENRRSIGQYPTPDGDDVVDAIPSWTQPVPPSGNWDDVILPVVARKKGLEGHYATADGSPRQKHEANNVIEPAPGTFGYDYSKYRRPRENGGAEEIQMDEFGQKLDVAREEPPTAQQPAPQPQHLYRNANESEHDLAHSRPSPPPSPPPFSRYKNSDMTTENGMHQPMEPPMGDHDKQGGQDDEGAGCCKCVIM
ncbi:hypothetical protein AcV7_004882 [Taiwanofungus camphoratus]|nr:hypothetical protein AcW2_007659 [Antrodia cinnamomea]KAI0930792.1 hypothetical protein AcV7_004882 [Antrodia cinnamomea]